MFFRHKLSIQLLAGTPRDDWRLEVIGVGSEPLAKTGQSSQACTLGVLLNHKSTLVPSGSMPPHY